MKINDRGGVWEATMEVVLKLLVLAIALWAVVEVASMAAEVVRRPDKQKAGRTKLARWSGRLLGRKPPF